jgi:flagellar biosynthesis component FlhA
MPYYFGKASTYGILAFIFFYLKTAFANFFIAKIFAFSLLILVSISFVVMSLSMGSFFTNLTAKTIPKIRIRYSESGR